MYIFVHSFQYDIPLAGCVIFRSHVCHNDLLWFGVKLTENICKLWKEQEMMESRMNTELPEFCSVV